MCEPISMSLLLGAGSAVGAAGAGASTLAAVGAGLSMVGTVYTGMQSANAALEAGYSQMEANFINSEEQMKKIEQIEAQAEVDELIRRNEFAYLTSKNLAAAAATGATADSESFEAIRERNRRNFAIDENVAAVNESNAKGQAAAQAQQFSRAGFAALSGAKTQRNIGLLNTGLNVIENAPQMDFSNIGVIGGKG